MDEFTYDALQYLSELRIQQNYAEDLQEWEDLQEQIEEIKNQLI